MEKKLFERSMKKNYKKQIKQSFELKKERFVGTVMKFD